MSTPRIEFDYDAIGQWANEALAGVIEDLTNEVADNARSLINDSSVEVTARTEINRKGRLVGVVTIAHLSGMARQAKHGTLTMAAAQAGLETKRTWDVSK